jgi:hypothetical protein
VDPWAAHAAPAAVDARPRETVVNGERFIALPRRPPPLHDLLADGDGLGKVE